MIKRHPRGAHQPILEKGANLSAGEKQLICMARCILQDAPVVIMDEATSALDPKAEALLAKISHKFFQHKTQLIIAHRLATVQECDSVIWMEKGRLIAKDKPEVILPEFQKKIDKGKES